MRGHLQARLPERMNAQAPDASAPSTHSTPNCLAKLAFAASRRLALPLAVHPGVALTGASVRDVVTNAQAQFEAQRALHERFKTPVVMTAMDLSAEAEAFGVEVQLSDDEIPTVLGRLITEADQLKRLAVPTPGDKRTAVYLETVRLLKGLPDKPLILAGSIGPFSLAGRLFGVPESLTLTIEDPDLTHQLVAKSTEFLITYAKALKAAGADGLLMAEPSAGLLSPRSIATFSSPYVKQVVAAVADDHFAFVLHNCAAKLPHLPAILEASAKVFHFGAPMDLPAALGKVPKDIVLCGNLDPAGVFCQSTPEEVRTRTGDLLDATRAFPNFIISSGCDVPPGAPFENLFAFYEAVAAKG
jgi:uroporphyrinogen decarboxylase